MLLGIPIGILLALFLPSCGTAPADPGTGEPEFEVTDPSDGDGDGIADQLEDHLMDVFGPELRLAPDNIDWTRPANVEWYLSRVHMRFDHDGCPDDGVLDNVTVATIASQQHYTKATGTGLCARTWAYSSKFSGWMKSSTQPTR